MLPAHAVCQVCLVLHMRLLCPNYVESISASSVPWLTGVVYYRDVPRDHILVLQCIETIVVRVDFESWNAYVLPSVCVIMLRDHGG